MKKRNQSNSHRYLYLALLCFFSLTSSVIAQTTFTEVAASYNLNLTGNKDGGHAWADYDLDGDFDLVVNRQGSGYLMRNDGGSFTDMTATLAPNFSSGNLERTALFVDFNNDGYPDIFRNSTSEVRIYLQDPNTNRFGNGTGGTTPNQTFNSGNVADGFNAEGAGALDFDGDGDLDIFIDNHDFGIDILENDGNGNFTHATPKSASPNPPYDVNDPTTWPLGLVQDAVDGDYGSATDFNNDGWVDIVVRKRSQVDLFTNIGGSFTDGVDIDDALNANKGAVGFYDFDNDGDFDLFWTENGDNQIHRNNGDGTWTGLGAATGIPVSFSGQIEGLACGDVDNDGDIDIFLANSGNGNPQTSKLYLNQINNGGGAMSFIDSGLTFGNRSEGSTFIDIDTDGDLDLYVNRNGNNYLYRNNLNATDRADHLYIDVAEDRDEFGLINTERRFGIGATAKILDCDGNVISGIREVNGGSGHGTQEPGLIHFGLPSGPDTPIVVEVAYPRTTTGRVIVRQQLTPSDYYNGSVNLLDVFTDLANEPPTANNDYTSVIENGTVSLDPLIDNGTGVDSDPESQPLEVFAITQPTNGVAVLNGDGTVTYTPNTDFYGSDTFTYTLRDNANCTFTSEQDIGTIYINVIADTDDDGVNDDVDLDDDNDGILDIVENPKTVLWVTNGALSSDQQNTIDKLTALGYTVTIRDDNDSDDAVNYAVTYIHPSVNSGTTFGNFANLATTNTGVITSENALYDEIIGSTGATGSTNTNNINILDNTHPITAGMELGNFDIGDGAFYVNNVVSGTQLGRHPNGQVNMAVWKPGEALDTGIAPGRRTIVPHTSANGGYNINGEDLLVRAIVWTSRIDSDNDNIDDIFDLDSDNDGIPDNVEAQTTTGYVPPNNDSLATYSANNGVNSAYLGGLTPTNTDGTDEPDYLDLNSDNEGHVDTTEAGITLAGVDTDNDGLDDYMDSTVGYADPGGTIDDPLSAPVLLLDSDNDANSGGDVDFRDATDDRPDNDNDGIVDADDSDDDNDGILDRDEGCGNLVVNGNFEAQDFSDAAEFPNGYTEPAGTFIGTSPNNNPLTGWTYTQNMDGWVGGERMSWSSNDFAEAHTGNQYIDVIGNNAASGGLNNVLSQVIATEIGETYTFSFFWGEDVGHRAGAPVILDVDVLDSGSNSLLSQTLNTTAQGIVDNIVGPQRWFYFEQTFIATTTATTIQFAATPDGTANGATLDYVYVSKNGACIDTDLDGVIDAFDLDSDNDGIYDAVEAGHNQAHTNGEVNGNVGTDGVPDAVQATPNGELVNYSILDSDSDLNMDFQEFDSDNDGCNDADEAYGAVGTDVDSNGKFGSGLPAVDGKGRVSAATYPVPFNGNGNSVFDYIEATTEPLIIDQPIDREICPTGNTTFVVNASNSNTYQWQLFNGTTWDDLSDGGIHSDTDAATLVITNASLSDNGNEYRVIVSHSAYICSELTSDEVTLTVAQPSVDAGSNQTICNGESATLTATPSGGSGSGYTYLWSTGATTQSIVVSPAGNSSSNVNVDYTVTITDSNNCTNNDTVRVIVEPTPTISVSNAPSCNFALFQPTTYTVEVTVSSGTVTSTAGAVTNTSGNVWQIADVPDGTDIIVTVTEGNCSTDLPIAAPNCACPSVDAPISGGDEVYCQGSTIPTLTASVDTGETVDWFAAATGGTALATGTTSYTPTSAATYYAEARSTTFAGCRSASRTPITLTEESPAVANIGPGQTVFVGQNATFTVATANADTYQWQVSTNGGATYSDISDGLEYSGTQTTTLTVSSVAIEKNGFLYRINASLTGSTCSQTTSSQAVLNVRVRTVITNRRITHRVKKE
ncbi:VCBS repeat-containing protein [Aurantibacter crassamenti]|uniref:FG-GAP-like repeat-containing protein n=1 Tax=Aurantibacter crassamenti TaxID=1837375 RepID=UPI0019397277|nr:FG-GAP-like repeat-containing protein [Aurantibacter crassamenti]MBM1107963.1 VCBS repeat-containing protein [Aurantibacter crassamenti]